MFRFRLDSIHKIWTCGQCKFTVSKVECIVYPALAIFLGDR